MQIGKPFPDVIVGKMCEDELGGLRIGKPFPDLIVGKMCDDELGSLSQFLISYFYFKVLLESGEILHVRPFSCTHVNTCLVKGRADDGSQPCTVCIRG